MWKTTIQYLTQALTLTWYDFKLRYIKTKIGLLWSIIRPFIMMLILYIIFSNFIGIRTNNYPLMLLLGIILWNFFADATLISINNLIDKREIIKKINLPITIIIVSSCLHPFLTALINLIIFFFLLIIIGIKISWLIIFFPIILLCLFSISLGLAFFLSAVNVIFRDLRYMWEVGLQLGFWITPVVYTVEMIPQKYLFFYLSNPLAWIIQQSRKILIASQIEWPFIFLQIIISFFVLILGLMIFKKMRAKIIEET